MTPSPYTTLCWKCNHLHAIGLPVCPKCGAVNANVDFDRAYAELIGERVPK
jgi:hypothetical protein